MMQLLRSLKSNLLYNFKVFHEHKVIIFFNNITCHLQTSSPTNDGQQYLL